MQQVGQNFQLDLMKYAQQQGLKVLADISKQIEIGMTEAQAQQVALSLLAAYGAEDHWHPPIIRFGANTCKIFSEASDPAVRLKPDDIFFIDLGPVFNGHEADIGETFCVGDQVEHSACVNAVRILFDSVAAHWQKTGCHGAELYEFAEQQALALGYVFNQEIKGHRVGDFPHKLYASGRLGDHAGEVIEGIWVLEVQIRHPELPIGAFKEQVLFKDLAVL